MPVKIFPWWEQGEPLHRHIILSTGKHFVTRGFVFSVEKRAANHEWLAALSIICWKQLSDLQEDLFPIEEIKNQPAGEEVERLRDKLVPVAVKQFDDAAEEEATRSGTVDDSWQHIDGDGIHADDFEEERPTAPTFYVDDVIE